jgi:hypothetical protein
MHTRWLAAPIATAVLSLCACGNKAEECGVLLGVANKDVAALKTAAATKPAGGPKELAAAARATADAADKLVTDLGKKGPTTTELQKASKDYQAVATAISTAERAYADDLDDLVAVQAKARKDRTEPDVKAMTAAHDAVKKKCGDHPSFDCKAVAGLMADVTKLLDKPTDLGKLEAELGKLKIKDKDLQALVDKLKSSVSFLTHTLVDIAAAESEQKDVEAKIVTASAAVDAALAKEAPVTASITAFCK